MNRCQNVPPDLEDFWNRRQTEPRHVLEEYVFGHPLRLEANDPDLLQAAKYSLPLFSRAPALSRPPFHIRLIASAERTPAGEPGDSLLERTWYAGSGDWLMIHLGPWGQVYVDLARREATAVLAPALAAHPDVVSQSLLNTVLLNFCLHEGYGMLHASCLVRDGRVLLLMAPHNSGKSTTALHLILAGYRLLTDSMVHVSPFHGQKVGGHDASLLCGFPVGKIKLRRDMLASFPQLQPLLETEQVRDETKYALDLRRLDPALVLEDAWPAGRVELCLLSRHDAGHSLLTAAGDEEVWEAVLHNSLFHDQESAWQRNLQQLTPLVERAGKHHLIIGSDPAGIVSALESLWA